MLVLSPYAPEDSPIPRRSYDVALVPRYHLSSPIEQNCRPQREWARKYTQKMLPGLQPSRPKVRCHSKSLMSVFAHSSQPPQQAAQSTYTLQQRRVSHEPARPVQTVNPQYFPPARPRSQVEAMPPFGPPHTPATFFTPVYDSAVRHPVFFTQTLKKPPFSIPLAASQGYNPVASGYIVEQRRAEQPGKTKL